MKKLAAIVLTALLLCWAWTPFVQAEEYTELVYLPLVSRSLSVQDMVSPEYRGMTVSCFIQDAVNLGIFKESELKLTKNCYICQWGDHTIDLYIPVKSGGYYNLFYGAVLENLQDYGKAKSTAFMSDTEHTYTAVKPAELEDTEDLLFSLTQP